MSVKQQGDPCQQLWRGTKMPNDTAFSCFLAAVFPGSAPQQQHGVPGQPVSKATFIPVPLHWDFTVFFVHVQKQNFKTIFLKLTFPLFYQAFAWTMTAQTPSQVELTTSVIHFPFVTSLSLPPSERGGTSWSSKQPETAIQEYPHMCMHRSTKGALDSAWPDPGPWFSCQSIWISFFVLAAPLHLSGYLCHC